MKLFAFAKKNKENHGDKTLGSLLAGSIALDDAGACPPPEDVAALVDSRLPSREKDDLMKHLARCSRCYGVYAMTHKIADIGKKEPDHRDRYNWKAFVPYALAAGIAAVFVPVYLVLDNSLPPTIPVSSYTQLHLAERKASENGPKRQAAGSLKTDGNYYAVVIGNNRYDDSRWLPELKTAVNDATEIAAALHERYGFETELLRNATRQEIFEAIAKVRKKLREEDSLLIYYGGHGMFDTAADKGYWLPRDAKKDDYGSSVQADDITAEMARSPARHVLVVADSCYSGTLTRSGLQTEDDRKDKQYGEYIDKMLKGKSRTLLASGGNEPVADGHGDGKHSIFAYAFLKALRKPERPAFTAQELFQKGILQGVAGNSDQTPIYDFVRNSGHEGGDFVFRSSETGTTRSLHLIETSAAQPTPASREADNAGREGVTGSAGYTEPVTGMEFVLVKGGCFDMGDVFNAEPDSDETPLHKVCVDDFYIGKYVVTQEQWRRIMGNDNNPSRFRNCGDNCPVERVSWNRAQDFINILNQRSGKNFRLPTEAEWEFAARSRGKMEKWAGTSDESELGRYAWHSENSQGGTRPVGTREPNGLGLYDMSGLIWQWTNDWYDEAYYGRSPVKNPNGPKTGRDGRVVRGGAWYNDAWYLRTTYRDWNNPARATNSYGFRLVLPTK